MPIAEIDTEQLTILAQAVQEISGMTFDSRNGFGLRISVKERMESKGINEVEEYLRLFKSDLYEQESLISLLSVPETYFLRDQRQFIALKEMILPEIIERKLAESHDRPVIKLVSCGCSIGAEPYSLAITVHQSGLEDRADFVIDAFDINKKSIEHAKKGEYNRYAFREPNTEFLEEFFTQKESLYQIRSEIKSKVRFHVANLFDPASVEPILEGADVLFFRNVLIYFSAEGIAQIIQLFEKMLPEKGYLFLGGSESLLNRKSKFQMQEKKDAYVWQLTREAQQSRVKPKPILPSNIKPIADSPNKLKKTIKSSEKRLLVPRKRDERFYEEGVGYSKLKQWEKAEKAFLKELDRNPLHLASIVELAKLYADSDREKEALAMCEKAIREDNLVADIYFILGLMACNRQEHAVSLANFKKTIYCDSTHFPAHYYLGLSYLAVNQDEKGRNQLAFTLDLITEMGPEALALERMGYQGDYIFSLCWDKLVEEMN